MTQRDQQRVYEFEGFLLDPRRRLLFGPSGRKIPLKPRVLTTLLYFVEHRGELIDKDRLMRAVWGGVIVEENSINKHVSTLRRALDESPGDHRFLVTIPGKGYFT